MVGRLSWMRFIGVATGFSLVVGLSVLPGTEAMAAAEESSPAPSLLLDPERPAPELETPDFEVPATEFPEGEFDAAAPVAPSEPVKFVGGGDKAAPELDAEELEGLTCPEFLGQFFSS